MSIDDVNPTLEADPAESRWGSWLTAPEQQGMLVVLAMAVGVITRLGHFLANTSLWHDELFVVENVVRLNAAELFGPLHYGQTAPPMWMVIEQMAMRVGGTSEYALRFIALLAGLMSLVIFWRVARLLLPNVVVPLAVLLFSLSDRLIVHSAEVKPYSVDVLVALVLTWIVVPRRGQLDWRQAFLIATPLATVFVWVSYPTVFVFGGLGIYMLGRLIINPQRASTGSSAGNWLSAIGCGVVFYASVIAFYLVTVSRQVPHESLEAYWGDKFPGSVDWWMLPVWLVKAHVSICDYAYEPLGGLLFGLAILGGWGWWRDGQRGFIALLLLPLVLTFVASCLKQYPYYGTRVVLFSAPAVILLSTNGVAALGRWPALRRRNIDGIVVAVLLGTGLILAGINLVRPRLRHEIRPVLTQLRDSLEPGDVLHVDCSLEFAWYWPRVSSGSTDDERTPIRWPQEPVGAVWYRVVADAGPTPQLEILAEPDPSAARLWIILVGGERVMRRDHGAYLDSLDADMHRDHEIAEPGANAILFTR